MPGRDPLPLPPLRVEVTVSKHSPFTLEDDPDVDDLRLIGREYPHLRAPRAKGGHMRLAAYFALEALRLVRDDLLRRARHEPRGYIWLNTDNYPCDACGRIHRYYTLGCTGHGDPPIALFPPPMGTHPVEGAGEIPFWREPPNSAWVDLAR